MINLKRFRIDRLVRDERGKPLGRVVLAGEYEDGANIPVAFLTVPRSFSASLKGVSIYVDGMVYKIPDDLPKHKITTSVMSHMVNNFYLERVS